MNETNSTRNERRSRLRDAVGWLGSGTIDAFYPGGLEALVDDLDSELDATDSVAGCKMPRWSRWSDDYMRGVQHGLTFQAVIVGVWFVVMYLAARYG